MKNDFKLTLKLFFTLIFVDFAALMLVISFAVIFSAVKATWVQYLFSQSFSLTILIVMIWQTLYIVGFKDSNMVRTGHMKENLYKGFIIGGLTQIPFALLLIVSIVFNFSVYIYRWCNFQYYGFITAIYGSVTKDLCMQSLGTVKIILLFLLLLIVPAISGGVYILGYKGIDLFSKFIYKKRKEIK